MSPPQETRIPIAVLTGFLGSGKTTVLRHLAQTGELSRTLPFETNLGYIKSLDLPPMSRLRDAQPVQDKRLSA